MATQFAALGLQPAGANGSWYQPVEFVRFTGGANGTMTVGNLNFTLGREMVMRASADTSALALDAPLVFVGYGIDMPSHGFDDYRGIDARGKIVVMLSGVPEGTPSDVAAHLGSEKRRMAAAHGAVGMITVRTRADAASAPWERAARFGNRPGTTWVEPNGTPYSDTGGHALPGDAQRGGGAAPVHRRQPSARIRSSTRRRPSSGRAASRCGSARMSPATPGRRRAWPAPTWSRSCRAPTRASPMNM